VSAPAATETGVRPAVFLDRDGVLMADYGYVGSVDRAELLPGAGEAVRRIRALGFAAVVVTNQSGVARGHYSENDVADLHRWMRAELAKSGAFLDAVYYCPHHPRQGQPPYLCDCDCRKPKPGMILRAAEELGLDLAHSIMVGDQTRDLQAARAARVPRRVLIGRAEESEAGLATDRFESLLDFAASLKADA
jgi:D-glycero-D-manno-heptose 1,7-bisphosphate phosphatase